MRTLADLENTLATSWTASDWWVYLTASHPTYSRRQRWRFAVRLATLVFRKWTALPGDRFSDFQRDVVWVVTGGRPGHLRGVPVSGQLVAAFGWPFLEDAITRGWAPNPPGFGYGQVVCNREPIPRHVL